MKPTISVAINTLNEQKNLGYALRSVRDWVDQIVVVDMHSQDRTREIAAEYGAEVYLHEPLGFADPARAFAIGKCRGDWLLVLDADELVPVRLSRTLRALSVRPDVDVVSIPRVNYVLGEPLEHTGWGPSRDRHERFFRRGKLRTSAQIHDCFKAAADAQRYSLAYQSGNAIVHFNYVDLTQFLEKLNRYTSVEARQALERGDAPRTLTALFGAAHEFFRRYLLLRGYRDGWRGLYLSLMMAFYRIATAAKLHELCSNGPREATERHYAAQAEAALADGGVP
jgi:glycosyltransferase involved in cell wall biosynthesis